MSRRFLFTALIVLLAVCVVSTGCAKKKKKSVPVPVGPQYSLTAQQDAVVIEVDPATAYGTQAGMSAGQINVGDPAYDGDMCAYILFDTSTVPATLVIDSVELRLYVTFTANNLGAGFTFNVCDVAATWDESTITFGSAPTATSVGTFTGPANGFTGWITVTAAGLQALVEDWVDGTVTNYGLALTPGFTTASVDGCDMDTHEGTNAPQLIIKYTTP